MTLGLLNAVTRREMANVVGEDGTKLKQEVEPLSNYFVGRATKDYHDGNLVVGGIATSVRCLSSWTSRPTIPTGRSRN